MKTPNSTRFALSPLQSDQLWLLTILAGICFLIAIAVVFVVSRFTQAPSFSWSAIGWVAPWYLAVISGWIMYVMVPMYVAHGRTRRFGFEEWCRTGLLLVVAGGVFMGIGYVLERGFYNLLSLTKLPEETMFANASGSISSNVVQFSLMFAVWYALGGMVGTALYRSPEWGWLSIPIALVVASLTGVWSATGIGFFGFVRRIVPSWETSSLWMDMSLSVLVLAVATYATWRMIQDVALRNP